MVSLLFNDLDSEIGVAHGFLGAACGRFDVKECSVAYLKAGPESDRQPR